MPQLQEIAISQFRNLGSVKLSPSTSANIIYGENGSGKTSLLEAIAVLAHGKSFRTHKFRRLIKEDETSFVVHAKIVEGESYFKTGLTKTRSGDTHIRVNGTNVKSASELAKNLPLLVMNTHSFNILEGPPKVRRQFFDWLVFHVEHRFSETWRSYTRCIKQRNSLLRHDKIDYSQISPWDEEIARLGADINLFRANAFSYFYDYIKESVKTFGFREAVTLELVDGWKAELGSELREQLVKNFERDKRLGYTSIGAHKSDIKIRVDKVDAVEVLSRGQQKVLITALFLGAAEAFWKNSERHPLFLLDDIAAELDERNIELMSDLIKKLGAQVFITCIEPASIKKFWLGTKLNCKMFHVEHGSITEASI